MEEVLEEEEKVVKPIKPKSNNPKKKKILCANCNAPLSKLMLFKICVCHKMLCAKCSHPVVHHCPLA